MQCLALAVPLVARIFAPSSWSVRKVLSYDRGGESGTFKGTAMITPYVDDDASGTLVSETGKLRVPSAEYDASSHTLFTLLDHNRIVLRFVDPGAKTSRPFADGVLRGDGDGCSCEGLVHPCGPDVYRGSIEFESPDVWRQRWRVDGPRKSGTIVTTYERVR